MIRADRRGRRSAYLRLSLLAARLRGEKAARATVGREIGKEKVY
jgi:hypothetical protein